MYLKTQIGLACTVAVVSLALSACAPKVGSERWCEAMGEQPKGEWSANDAAAYAKHCVLGIAPDE
jgi:hypothetical protein